MINKRNLLILVLVFLAVFASACSGAMAEHSVNKKVRLQFITHLAADMPEQDVFVEVVPGANQVRRITVADRAAYTDTPVYGSQELILHDPFQVSYNPLGAYTKGAPLGFTMGEWLAGTGVGTYTVAGDEAAIDLNLEHLVPNGVYTIECASINVPPNFSYIDTPCGTKNTVIANPEGRVNFYLALKPLPDSTAETVQVIAVTYHSDGRTYGAYSGDFGLNSHVQILAFIPMPESVAWQSLPDDSSIAQQK